MLVIFCEECGGKNNIDEETLEQLEEHSIDCQICKNHISRETIISYSKTGNSVHTKNIQLLFIDDDSLFLEMMLASMEKDYSVSVALSGKEGLQMAAKIHPDLIFLDVNMPGMSGYEVCTHLKNDKTLRHIPIIFVSAGTEINDEQKGLSIGAVDYITKPIDHPIFHTRVAMHIRLKKIRDVHQKEMRQYQEIITTMREDRRKLVAALKEKSRDLLSLKNGMETLDQLVILQDQYEKIRWANQATLKTFGLSMDEIKAYSCSQLFCNDANECPPCSLSQSENGKAWQIHKQFSDKLQADVIHTHLPVFNDEGKMLSQIHFAEIGTQNAPEKEGQDDSAPQYIANHLPEIKKLIKVLTLSVDSVTNVYKDDKRLIEFNTYITDYAQKLKNLLDGLPKTEKKQQP